MRNLIQYPITQSEVIGVLSELAEQLSKKDDEPIIGDIRPLVLDALADAVAELRVWREVEKKLQV